MIGQSFEIRNSAMADLVVTVSIIHEQNLNFAGILIERSKYDNPDSEALLRLLNFPILKGGMTMFSLSGANVIDIKSNTLSAESGGTVVLKYPTDFKNDQFSDVELNISSTQNGFVFLSPNNASFSTMHLDVWYNIFSQNFGVKEVTFQ
jgi:hypothetical protein